VAALMERVAPLWPPPCRLAPAIPSQHRAAFVQAAVAGLAPGSPPPVQIGACRALAQVGGRLPAGVSPHMPERGCLAERGVLGLGCWAVCWLADLLSLPPTDVPPRRRPLCPPTAVPEGWAQRAGARRQPDVCGAVPAAAELGGWGWAAAAAARPPSMRGALPVNLTLLMPAWLWPAERQRAAAASLSPPSALSSCPTPLLRNSCPPTACALLPAPPPPPPPPVTPTLTHSRRHRHHRRSAAPGAGDAHACAAGGTRCCAAVGAPHLGCGAAARRARAPLPRWRGSGPCSGSLCF
jgi:hypothetical protein